MNKVNKKVFLIIIMFIMCMFSIVTIKASTILSTCYNSTCTLSINKLYMSSIATAGEIDHWTFTATSSNSYYVIETYGNTDMFMYSYMQNEVITNNNGGEKLNANIGFLNSESGTQYDFVVKAYSQYSTGKLLYSDKASGGINLYL